MSNLLPIHLYYSIRLALIQCRYTWDISESRRSPFIALDTVLRLTFQRCGERGQSYIRSISHYFALSNHEKKSRTKPSYDALRRPFRAETH